MFLVRGAVGEAGVTSTAFGVTIPLKPWRLDGGRLEDALIEISGSVSQRHARYLERVLKPFGLVELRCFRDADTAELVLLSLESSDSLGKPIHDDELRAIAARNVSPPEGQSALLQADISASEPERAAVVKWKPSPYRASLPMSEIPDSARVEPIALPGVGVMVPSYRRNWKGDVQASQFISEPVDQTVFRCDVRVAVWADHQPAPEVEALFAMALRNFAAAGSALRDSITPFLLLYYHAVRDDYGDDECIAYGIPLSLTEEDVWDHISLARPASLDTSIGAFDSASVHPDSAYLVFEGECAWEQEHGLQLTILNGNTIVKVGPFDGHLTNYSAADPGSIDRVFRW